MVSAHQALYEYIYSKIGNSVTEDGVTFNYYSNPPENATSPYIWCNVTTLSDSGPRDAYIYNLLAEFTVVAFTDVNRTAKDQILAGQLALAKLFTVRGLNTIFVTNSGDSVKLISQMLMSLEEGTEEMAQKTLTFAKVNINFTLNF